MSKRSDGVEFPETRDIEAGECFERPGPISMTELAGRRESELLRVAEVVREMPRATSVEGYELHWAIRQEFMARDSMILQAIDFVQHVRDKMDADGLDEIALTKSSGKVGRARVDNLLSAMFQLEEQRWRK